MKSEETKEMENLMNKNPNNWKGIFYFNRRDHRLVVPKRDPSLGWTLNFASPYTYLFLIAIIAIALASEFLK
ncbi:MAG TPA: DUF5808 domain-containing protein [Bacteroidales bacterium]|nr:DUF5808 domain-containing protein [Bacteroidales bacterium]